MDARQLPPESIAQAATSMASRHKSVATIMFWLDGLFVCGAIAMAADQSKLDWASKLGGMLFWVALFTFLAVRSLRKASRATRIGARASADRSLTWYLNQKVIVGANATGAPLPDLSFKVTSSLINVLTAVPQARVVSGN
jgi:hypothetical protein